MAAALGLTPGVIEDRLATMDLSPSDRDGLRLSLPALEANADDFIETLYQRLTTSSSTSGWFQRPEALPRLKAQQRGYLIELFSASLDWAYVQRRLQIGVAHHRVRLTPRWYLATCAHFVCDHIGLILRSAPSPEEGVERVIVLVKTILFDASLVLDAYGMSLEEALRTGESCPRFDGEAASHLGGETSSPRQPSKGSPAPLLRMPLTADDCQERRLFLGIDDSTLSDLRSLEGTFQSALPGMLQDFYTVFRQWGATGHLLPAEVVERLLRQVSSYWMELTQATFDRLYASSRTRIGVVHEQIGVSPQVYLVGLARQVSSLLRAISKDHPDPGRIIGSLLRGVFCDVTFVIDAYMDARATSVLGSEGYAAQLLACLTVGVAVLDSELRVRSANPALLQLLGVEAAIIRHLPAADLVPDSRVVGILQRAVANPKKRESILVAFGGRRLRITAVQMEFSPDAPSSPPLALLVDDVTDLAELAPEVQRAENRLAETVSAVDAVFWEAEPATWILEVISRPVLGLTGFRDVHFLGRPNAWLDRIPEPDRARFMNQCSGLDLHQRCALVHRLTHADGSTRWVRTHVVRSGASLSASVFRGVSMDVSVSFLEEKRRLAAVGRLAGSIAHEFNGLLTVVSGNLGLLAEDAGPANSAEIKAINQAVARGAVMTQQLQTFAQGAPMRSEPAVLNEVLRSLESTLKEFAGSRIEVAMQVQPDLWPCQVDKVQFCGVLLNLVTNSRDSMPQGGTLRIETRNVHAREILPTAGVDQFVDHVEVAVADTGQGMEPEIRARSVEPFFSTKPEGAGLGLSVVHGFVQQSRGYMIIESGVNQGTTVRLRFPRIEHVSSPGLPVDTEPREASRRILVVEDDPMIGKVLQRMLARRGHAVQVVASPAEARRVINARPPELVICDVVFSGRPEGAVLGKELAELMPELPVVYMSGYTKDSLALGPEDRFISKPFTFVDLDRLLEEVFATGC